MEKPTAARLIEATGISSTHAYDILSGRESPSMGLALTIFAKTGWRAEVLTELHEATIADLLAKHLRAKAA